MTWRFVKELLDFSRFSFASLSYTKTTRLFNLLEFNIFVPVLFMRVCIVFCLAKNGQTKDVEALFSAGLFFF